MRRMFLLGLGVALAAGLSLASTRAIGGVGDCLEYAMCANPADVTDRFPYQYIVFSANEEGCQTVCEKWVTSCNGAASAAANCLFTQFNKFVAVSKAGCKTGYDDEAECLDYYNGYKAFCENQITNELASGKGSCSDNLDECIAWCTGP
ncbi:MAG: hypothetical protein HYZ50_25685 [Deltaproteobacteria bacterium]|nr:hypothetical protein [Deltaproteobacteria bacterium]